jgi:glycosyltransferase involved in cell wall biosynthesis
VDSALSQKGVKVDVVVVDDKSTDDSLAVAQRLAVQDARVRVVAHLQRLGPVETFNDGLRRVRGEFLVRLDADDLLTPGSLQRSVAVMQRFPAVGLVYGHPLHFSDGKRPAHRDRPTSWIIWSGREWLEGRCRSGLNVITSPEAMMRRSVVDAVGGQMPLAHTHDMEMWLRMSAFCDVAYIRGADQAWHREHPESLSATLVSGLRDLIERRDAFEMLFRGRAAGISEAALLFKQAKAALAAHAVQMAIRQYDHGMPNEDEIGSLRSLARALVPNVESIPGWTGLDRRIAMGGERARQYPPYFVERVVRGLRSRYSYWKWHRTGEW